MRRIALLGAGLALLGSVVVACSGGSSDSETVAEENVAYTRLVVFDSEAPNLVPPDSSDALVVFLRDRVAKTTELISATSDGSPADVIYGSEHPFMSADGRFVVFHSDASNLVTGQLDCIGNCVFVRDRTEDTTELIAEDGEDPVISGDGRFIAYVGSIRDCIDCVFVLDRETGATDATAEEGEDPAISADGRRVAFQVWGGTNEVFVTDLEAGATEPVSVSSDGRKGSDDSGDGLAISADGRFVAFDSDASNLVSGDTNKATDVFVRDLTDETTERVSLANDGVQASNGAELSFGASQAISSDGRFVAFNSESSNLVPGDTNRSSDVFVRDRLRGTTERVSVLRRGVQLGESSGLVSLSPDGRFVVFDSSHIFIYDRRKGKTERVDVPIAPARMGDVKLQPTAPRAGQSLLMTAPVTVSGEPVPSAKVTCQANIAGRAVRTVAHVYKDGVATCKWALPTWSTGESLDGQMAATTPSGRAERAVLVDITGTRQALAWRVVAAGAKVPPLNDVVALSPSDVWAVGGGYDDDGNETPPAIVHWDGQRLRSYRPLAPSSAGGELWAVAAVAADDVWAVGSDGDGPVAMHWDGRQWKRVQLPSLKGASLSDVAAIAGNDVWVVGRQGSRPLTLHWDGAGWRVYDMSTVVRSPSELYAVDGVSATAVWAVGAKNTDLVQAGLEELILRWDGRQWKRVSFGISWSQRDAIDALSEGDVWTLGEDLSYEDAGDYILHWDGRRETRFTHDGPYGIAAASPTSAFAVGYYDIVHWDGTRWRVQPAAFLTQHDTHLEAVSALSGTEAWAVGDHLMVRYSR